MEGYLNQSQTRWSIEKPLQKNCAYTVTKEPNIFSNQKIKIQRNWDLMS